MGSDSLFLTFCGINMASTAYYALLIQRLPLNNYDMSFDYCPPIGGFYMAAITASPTYQINIGKWRTSTTDTDQRSI